MKNKRLVVILLIFALLTFFVILGSTVFTVSKIEIKWKTTVDKLSGLTDNEIIDSGNFELGESVFLTNKKEYINNIEKNIPYIKVYSIETVFPNKLVVYVGERVPLYALKVTDSASIGSYSYIILDEDLKVLNIRNTISNNSNSEPIILSFENTAYTDIEFNVGTFAGNIINSKILKNFAKSVKVFNFDPVYIFKNMSIQVGYKTTIILQPLDNEEIENVTFIIKDATIRLTDKVEKVLSIIQYHLKEQEASNITIEVLIQNNQVVGIISN